MAAGSLTETVVEEVASNLEEAAVVTRRLDGRVVGSFAIGLGVGLAAGFYFGYRFNRKKLRAEILADAEKEIEQVREVYRQRATAAQEKPSVDEVMERRGYSVKTPEVEVVVEDRPLKPPVPVMRVKTAAQYHQVAQEAASAHVRKIEWDEEKERESRTEGRPYIIHQDDFHAQQKGYRQEALTYYAEDGVLVNEQEEEMEFPDRVVGLANLKKFGHGSDDEDVMFVRNDLIATEFEVCRLNKSYIEEVRGLFPNDESE